MVQSGLPKLTTHENCCVERKSATGLSCHACKQHHLQIEPRTHLHVILAVKLLLPEVHCDLKATVQHLQFIMTQAFGLSTLDMPALLCTLGDRSHDFSRLDTLLLNQCIPHLGIRRC